MLQSHLNSLLIVYVGMTFLAATLCTSFLQKCAALFSFFALFMEGRKRYLKQSAWLKLKLIEELWSSLFFPMLACLLDLFWKVVGKGKLLILRLKKTKQTKKQNTSLEIWTQKGQTHCSWDEKQDTDKVQNFYKKQRIKVNCYLHVNYSFCSTLCVQECNGIM